MGGVDERAPDIRVGDDERRAVDSLLQRAHAEGRITLMEYDERSGRCWEARTRADLDALTHDLPRPAVERRAVEVPGSPARAAPGARHDRSPFSRAMGVAGTVAALAVLGYAGVQVLGAADGRAVFGDTTVSAVPGQEELQVGMLFGDIDVVVPDGTHVATTGTVLAGDVRCARACTPAGPGERTLVVDASGALGDVQVFTETEFSARSAGEDRRGDR